MKRPGLTFEIILAAVSLKMERKEHEKKGWRENQWDLEMFRI